LNDSFYPRTLSYPLNPISIFLSNIKLKNNYLNEGDNGSTRTSMSRSTVQDKGKFRENLNDKFYTNPETASRCIQLILDHCPDYVDEATWVEPSAGNGSFLKVVPKTISVIGMDIEPEEKGITKQDYLKWVPKITQQLYLVFGNPPFGRQSSMAKAFIRKSCSFASIIAFILPKSFTKPSMYQVFDPFFHLVHTEELSKDSFLVNDRPYDVPCVFQIWGKREEPREEEQKTEPIGFEYVKGTAEYDFACRRVGVYAGRCYPPTEKGYSIQSHYFIKLVDPSYDISEVIERMNGHTFPSNTVGPRSLSKPEINIVLNQFIS